MLLAILACDGGPQRIYSSAELEADIAAYEEWDHAPGWPDVHAACDGTHLPLVEIWLNDVAFAAFADEPRLLPDAAALVLQTYADDQGTLGVLTAMRKVEGLDPEHGDWFWGAFDADGAVMASGTLADDVGEASISECVTCHASGTDFVRFPTVTPATSPADCP